MDQMEQKRQTTVWLQPVCLTREKERRNKDGALVRESKEDTVRGREGQE